jgi:N6-L-threonylcarbamoyladenine synthase
VQANGMRESADARQAALAAIPNPRPEDALALLDAPTLDLIASFQHAVVGILIRQTLSAAECLGARGIVVSGGVAANRELRARFQKEAAAKGLPIAFPSLALSTDNAAMIAAAAWPKLLAEDFATDDLGATPQLKLG